MNKLENIPTIHADTFDHRAHYRKLYTWHEFKDTDYHSPHAANLATVGASINIKFYPKEAGLNPNLYNRYRCEIQYDYTDPDSIGNFADGKGGTFGEWIICKTMEEAKQKCIDFLMSDFDGIKGQRYETVGGQQKSVAYHIEPKNACTRVQLAKIAFFHAGRSFPFLDEKETLEAMNKEDRALYKEIGHRYKNRSTAYLKYEQKLITAVKTHFKRDLNDFVQRWKFMPFDLLRSIGSTGKDKAEIVKEIGAYKHKLIMKVGQYYN